MKGKIPTIIGIVILIVSIGAGVCLIKNRQLFRLGAIPDIAPKDVRISNITDSSFTVSWTTDKETSGFVKWGKNQTSLDKVESDTISEKGTTHSISVRSLTPLAQYYFKINSDGTDFDNQGTVWQIKTGSSLVEPQKNIIISGNLLTQGGKVVKDALVYFSIGGGSTLSTVTSKNGSWLIPISSARTKTLNSYIPIDEASTLIEISINAGSLGISSAQIYPQSAKPAPPIILGQVNDFKNAPISKDSQLPNASIEVPEGETEAESGFNLEEGQGDTSTETVTLDSLEEGEVISTENPEFFGKGPSGTEIEITIESNPQSGEATISPSGSWKWSPPEDLPEGTHKITIKWRDINGILRKLTRNFIVQAAETPAFVSTPSATPTQTPTSTPSATPTATATVSASPSASPEQPDSGSLIPTLLLLITGVVASLFGIIFWKKSEI